MTLPAGFAPFPRWLIRTPKKELSNAGKVLLMLLVSYAWEDGHCFPSQSRIASDLGWGTKTVHRTARYLEHLGFIRVEQRGFHKTLRYVLLFNPFACDPGDTSVRKKRHPRPPKEDTHVRSRGTPVSDHYSQLATKGSSLQTGVLYAAKHPRTEPSAIETERNSKATLVATYRRYWEREGFPPQMLFGLRRELAAKLKCSEEEAGSLLGPGPH
jgi:hypothetical protein